MKRRTSKFLLRDITTVSFLTLILLLAVFIGRQVVNAATLASQYSYTLTGSSATVLNGAAANTAVSLNLSGNWNQSDFGVHFAGDLVSQQSVAYAKPASGATINVPANQSVGVAIKFKYQAPTGATCFNDSPNITQIGRFGQNLAQIKLQLSNCGKNANSVFAQCRIAGSNSTTKDFPVTGTQALIDGETYVVKCLKAPDPLSGNTPLQLKTAHIDPVNGNQVADDAFFIRPTGLIRSFTYLSVANKYPLPQITSNTDQFVGDIAKVAYCKATTLNNVKSCLDTEIPE